MNWTYRVSSVTCYCWVEPYNVTTSTYLSIYRSLFRPKTRSPTPPETPLRRGFPENPPRGGFPTKAALKFPRFLRAAGRLTKSRFSPILGQVWINQALLRGARGTPFLSLFSMYSGQAWFSAENHALCIRLVMYSVEHARASTSPSPISIRFWSFTIICSTQHRMPNQS